MSSFEQMTSQELQDYKALLKNKLDEYANSGLCLDMSRGKPAQAQLDLSRPLLSVVAPEVNGKDGSVDCLNYGCLEGIPSARTFFGAYLGVPAENVLVYGESSLNIMHDLISHAFVHGVCGHTAWSHRPKVKFLCPSPGYDRHFAIAESFGIELISVDMTPEGPDMDRVEELIADDQVVGMWCVPKYSNPTGITFSDEVVRRVAALRPAAPDFRVYWDDAYAHHHLYTEADKHDALLSLWDACHEANNPDICIIFGSTSKVTFPGAGVSACAASRANLDDFISKTVSFKTIGHDKINQLRHVLSLSSRENPTDLTPLYEHMRAHAQLLKPKFDLVDQVFSEELSGIEGVSWSRPQGGYFISFYGPHGSAQAIVDEARRCGVTLTEAGSAYPYGKDPEDSHIRIAPSFPSCEELKEALNVFVCCVKYQCACLAEQKRLSAPDTPAL